VSVEILHDRSFGVWSRSVLAGVESNLLTVCADALAFVREVLEDDSVDELFVNFPEPAPEGATHFLATAAFASSARRVLKPASRLTLVTDNKTLAQTIHRTLSDVCFCGSVTVGDAVPADYGSSYFDRLWSNGKRTDRFIVQAHKF
jgi:tRNA (guanine-N7-)-methyltransferase